MGSFTMVACWALLATVSSVGAQPLSRPPWVIPGLTSQSRQPAPFVNPTEPPGQCQPYTPAGGSLKSLCEELSQKPDRFAAPAGSHPVLAAAFIPPT